MVRCLRKPIAKAPVSVFQDPQKRGAEPLGRPREKTELEPVGRKQTRVCSSRPEGQKGNSCYKHVRELQLRNFFADDPDQGGRMTAEAEGVFVDYSKNRITDETINLLVQLAEESGLRARIDAMFRG